MPYRRAIMGGLLALALSTPAAAQYPNKPITVIVPFAAGGPTDVVTRLVGEHMSRTLGQTMVVENVGGAGGTLGMTRAAQAEPDGYTIAVGNMGTQSAAPALYPNLKYDPATSFAQIGIVNFTPQAIVAKKDDAGHKSQGVPRLPQGPTARNELRPRRRRLDLACVGLGVQFEVRTRIRRWCPIAAPGRRYQDLVAGQIDYMVDQSLNVIPQIKAGTIKAYAVAAPKRLESLPDVPTTGESRHRLHLQRLERDGRAEGNAARCRRKADGRARARRSMTRRSTSAMSSSAARRPRVPSAVRLPCKSSLKARSPASPRSSRPRA